MADLKAVGRCADHVRHVDKRLRRLMRECNWHSLRDATADAFLRWRAERWIKVRHTWTLFKHDPLFIMHNLVRLFTFHFRGCTLKTFLRLEDERRAFARYRLIRAAERNYV